MPRILRVLTLALLRRLASLLALAALGGGCAALPSSVPDRAYYPEPAQPRTVVLAQALWRAAEAAGHDPAPYSFAMVKTRKVSALSADDGVFYFSDGLAAEPPRHMDALIAHAVAHEVLGHAGTRRALSLGVSGGFTALGIVVPGLGLADFVVNPLIVRAFSREQILQADQRAVQILRAMGYQTPRRLLANALVAADVTNGSRRHRLLAKEPRLDDRLAALEPLESSSDTDVTALIGRAIHRLR